MSQSAPDPRERIDFPAIAGAVAEALWGAPAKRSGREWRWGTHGSRSLDIEGGRWYDHEASEGGGVLDLVRRERQCDTAAAMEWLRGEGFVGEGFVGDPKPALSGPERPPEPTSARPGTSGRGEGRSPVPDARAACAARLWAASVPPDPTPGRRYLAGRWAWPPLGIESAPDLPASVRWLARERQPDRDPAAKWYGLPDGAVGALAFAWRPASAAAAAPPVAVSLEALDADGARLEPRWRRTFGSRKGAAFEARAPAGDADPVHVAEGEVDALALALAPWATPGRVLAAGGTSGLRAIRPPGNGPVVLHCDGERGGRLAASEVLEFDNVSLELYAPGADPASALAEWIEERAAIREFDGGEAREDADRGAWMDLLREDCP